MKLSTLDDWLNWIDKIHFSEIELGLDRIRLVADKLGLLHPAPAVIIIGGTNGKGSTVAGLEAIYRAADYRVGAFTTPILFKHNEQVRINGIAAEDQAFCTAFARIEQSRGDVSLTPFEYHTLAALQIFKEANLDILLLEVGMGGRLDAVNIIEPDVAIVTSIALDHTAWLGDTREAIAYEKAGIFRSGKPAICGDLEPPASLLQHAAQLGTPLYCQGKAFYGVQYADHWQLEIEPDGALNLLETHTQHQHIIWDQLPYSQLAISNMAQVLMAIWLLQARLPLSLDAIRAGLANATLPGRLQLIQGPKPHIYDVSHNPAACACLAKFLRDHHCEGRTLGVFSMLGDKDIAASIAQLQDEIDAWYIAPLTLKRAATLKQLQQAFNHTHRYVVYSFNTLVDAYQQALSDSQIGDRIVIFGSFHTVATLLPLCQQ